MTETTNKIQKWSYPLKVGTGEATGPQQFYKALAKAKDGYYPLGVNGLWHGGVHFDEASGLVNDLTEVRCIADGEVVAYRIDEKYPTSDFGSTHSVYSTGFVLVKHRLELPAPSTPAPATGAAAAPGPSLTFFSLYMHLLDWETYKANPSLKPPGFWGKGLYQVKENLRTKSLGLRVREGNSSQTPILAVLPRGTKVLTKPAPSNQSWLAVVSVTPEFPSLAVNTGWVFKGEMKHLGGESYLVGEEAQDAPPDQKSGANVRDTTRGGQPIAFLPAGTQIRISDEQAARQYRKLVEIISGQPIPALNAGDDGKLPGFVWLEDLEAKNEPHGPIGQVIPLAETFKIKAGEVLGHVGKYQTHADSAPKNLLHLEVFSCEDVEAFTNKSKEKAIGLPAAEKTLVKIPVDTWLVTHAPHMNSATPPKAADPGNKVGYDFYIPVGLLEALPAEKKIKESVVMGTSTSTTYWWRLDGLLGGKDGSGIDGWFAEPDTVLSRHSPFEWDGFTFINETTSNVDHLAAFLHAQESLDEQERESYLPNVETALAGSVNETLYKILDRNGDKKIAPSEIAEALGKPWFSQPISQMVTRYENEWDYKKETWDALDEIIGHSDSDPHKAWVEEKARIERLSWWDKLKGKHGIDSANVWHIHPLGFIGNFAGKAERELITRTMLKAARPNIADDYCESILPFLNKYARLYKIDTPLRIAHLLSQVGHESGFKIRQEDLDYNPRRMREMFGCRNNQNGYNAAQDECIVLPRLRPKLWSEPATYAHNPVNLGSYVYGGRNGNGNEASQEGYKYRGRGIIQLTGKSNYREYTRIHNLRDPADPKDFVVDPDLIVNELKYGIESAFVWWDMNDMNGLIATSYASRTEANISLHVADISTKVNGGTIGLANRVILFNNLRGMVEAELN